MIQSEMTEKMLVTSVTLFLLDNCAFGWSFVLDLWLFDLYSISVYAKYAVQRIRIFKLKIFTALYKTVQENCSALS